MLQTVEVKSAWLSKINWTQAIAAIAALFTLFGHTIPDNVQADALAAITCIASVVTWFQRTFLTTSITPASAAMMPTVSVTAISQPAATPPPSA